MSDPASLLEWFRGRWADTAQLQAKLPISKIKTGESQTETGDQTPSGSLNVESSIPLARSSDAVIRQTALRLQVWSDSHSWGEELGLLIEQHLDNVSETTAAFGVLSLRVSNRFALQEEDGVWQHVSDFEAVTQF